MILFIDLETTGLPRSRNVSWRDVGNWPRIVTISWALHHNGGERFVQRDHVVRPDGYVIPPESTRIHGISTEHARRVGVPVDNVLNRLIDDLRRHRPTLLVAHNMDFDRNILLAEIVRSGAPLDIERLPVHCTMITSTNICRIPGRHGDYKWPTLLELHRELFGKEFMGQHDASADVQACARCYFEIRSARERGDRAAVWI